MRLHEPAKNLHRPGSSYLRIAANNGLQEEVV